MGILGRGPISTADEPIYVIKRLKQGDIAIYKILIRSIRIEEAA